MKVRGCEGKKLRELRRRLMITVQVSNEIEHVCPDFVGAAVEAHVVNSHFCQPLWDEIHELGE